LHGVYCFNQYADTCAVLPQATINHIENQMKSAVEGSSKLQSENDKMGGKLNDIVKKYQAREAVSWLYCAFLWLLTKYLSTAKRKREMLFY